MRTTFLTCPVCGEAAPFVYPHPEARIYRCPKCTHAFSDPASIEGVERYSDNYYEETHRNWFANPNLKLFGWIESQLPKTAKSLIDIGCGRGQFLDFIRTRRPDIRLVGADLSSNADRNGIEFHRGSAFDLDLGTFDAVVSLATIEHVADAGRFTKTLYSLCNPGGLVVVMTLDGSSILYRVARLARRLGMPLAFNRVYGAHHFHHFTHRSLRALLERNALNIRRTLRHSVPVRAIDVPVENPIVRPLFLGAAATLLAAGDLTGWSYLQTIVATRPADR